MKNQMIPEVETLSKEQHRQRMEEHSYQLGQLNKKMNMNGDLGFLGGDLKSRNYHSDMLKMHQQKYLSLPD